MLQGPTKYKTSRGRQDVTDPDLGRDLRAGQNDVSKGRCVLQRLLRAPKVTAEPFYKKSWPGTAQSSVRVAAGGVVPDAKFNIFWRPHISERAPL